MNDENKKQEEEIDFDKQEAVIELRRKVQELKEEVANDLKINTSDLIEDCKNAPNITQKYLELFTTYRRKLGTKQIILENVEAEWFAYYKSLTIKKGHKFGDRFPRDFNSTDAKRMVSMEKEYIRLATIVSELKETVLYLEEVIRSFRDRQYQIKNIIEIMKLEQNGQ